tara:strand:- start:43 stop:177 length:135 start_codon:yes stop_codon:yes gene_type:complete
VSDDYASKIQLAYGFGYLFFPLYIQVTGGFIQYQYLWLFVQSSR